MLLFSNGQSRLVSPPIAFREKSRIPCSEDRLSLCAKRFAVTREKIVALGRNPQSRFKVLASRNNSVKKKDDDSEAAEPRTCSRMRGNICGIDLGHLHDSDSDEETEERVGFSPGPSPRNIGSVRSRIVC